MTYENTLEFAKQQDTIDPLKGYRNKFYFPMMHGREAVYLTGNSLGLQPKATQDYVLNELPNAVLWLRKVSPLNLEAGAKSMSHPEAFAGENLKVKAKSKSYK